MSFTKQQVERLWQHQFGPWSSPFDDNSELPARMHPYTCANRGDGNHSDIGGDLGILVPTVNGWICPFCDYKQSWSHDR